MPRQRIKKTSRGECDITQYENAYEEVKKGTSLRKAAEMYGVHHSSLLRYKKKRDAAIEEDKNNNKNKHPKLKKSRTNTKKLSLQWKNEDSNSKHNGNQSTRKGHGAGHHARQAMGFPFSSETDSDFELNERKRIKKGVAGHLLDIKEEDAVSSLQHLQLQPKAFIAPAAISLKGNRPYPLYQKVESNFWGSQELGPDFPMLSGEAGKISKESLTKADKKEYEEICPSVCPSRDVMVCGKCQHGIYKTFIGVCDLRMFACNHQDEILQLVSRYPCVLSAPYIPDSSTKPKGRILEPGDDDPILRFIMCRDQGKLGTDEKPSEDPRCNFRPTKDKHKYYDFKGNIMYMDSHLLLHEGSSEY